LGEKAGMRASVTLSFHASREDGQFLIWNRDGVNDCQSVRRLLSQSQSERERGWAGLSGGRNRAEGRPPRFPAENMNTGCFGREFFGNGMVGGAEEPICLGECGTDFHRVEGGRRR